MLTHSAYSDKLFSSSLRSCSFLGKKAAHFLSHNFRMAVAIGGAEITGTAVIESGELDPFDVGQDFFECIERLSALTLLAAGVAHEIGNPLNSLHIHLQLMERKVKKLGALEDKCELLESIDIARAEINRLDSIVSQFLRAIRPSKPHFQPEDVNALVLEAISFFRPEIKDRDIVVETELRSDLPSLEVDRDQMKQVFYNAIKNSFEAMKRRGILRIRTDRDDTHVKISFTDTGGGISAENLSRVFEPYFTTKEGGSGLGLLIVRRIVREHGGELSIESSEGKGLTLTIRLPLLDRRVRMLADRGRDNDERADLP